MTDEKGWKQRALYEEGVRRRLERRMRAVLDEGAAPRTARRERRFWTVRLIFILANAPVIAAMQLFRPSWLVPYLVWMSWGTWLSSELPTKGE